MKWKKLTFCLMIAIVLLLGTSIAMSADYGDKVIGLSAEVTVDAFDFDPDTTVDTAFGYNAGRIRKDNKIINVAGGTVDLTDDSRNYIEVGPTGAVSANATGFTKGSIPLYVVYVASEDIKTPIDKRAFLLANTVAPILDNSTTAETTVVITSADYGKTMLFTYAGAVAVTLPANGATAGSWFRCINASSDTTAPTYSAATADTLITFNNAEADSVTYGTGHRIGSCVMFISNGSFWVAINESGSNTMTVTDA